MSRPAIVVEHLSKSYRIGHRGPTRDNFREAFMGLLSAPLRRFRELGEHGSQDETFWALNDVSFAIQPGEVVGVIGRNGAGKSTILKILSRITSPTEGTVRLRGRVASLLEVGTGFHPELTGRENIYLNGSILGMTKTEIDRKFDEIVAFSGVEKFLDTPVKRYSSGMHVRLGFAVAAHLESDILIIDEVLAVGDINFQKKCLGKMEEVAGHGRTVLFVSHNMNTITRLCPRAILLQRGQLIADGPSYQVSRTYLQSDEGSSAIRTWPDPSQAPGDDVVRLRSVRIRDEQGHTIDAADIRKPVGVEIVFDVLTPGHRLIANFHFVDEQGQCAFVLHDNQDPTWGHRPRPVGTYTSTAWIPGNFLAEGSHVVSAVVSTHNPVVHVHAQEPDAVAFMVIDSHEGDSARGDYLGVYPGVVRPIMPWETRYEPAGPSDAVSLGNSVSRE